MTAAETKCESCQTIRIYYEKDLPREGELRDHVRELHSDIRALETERDGLKLQIDCGTPDRCSWCGGFCLKHGVEYYRALEKERDRLAGERRILHDEARKLRDERDGLRALLTQIHEEERDCYCFRPETYIPNSCEIRAALDREGK